jgi:hypothetical protein
MKELKAAIGQQVIKSKDASQIENSSMLSDESIAMVIDNSETSRYSEF